MQKNNQEKSNYIRFKVMEIDRAEARTILKAIRRKNEIERTFVAVPFVAVVAVVLCLVRIIEWETFVYAIVPVMVVTNFILPVFFERPSYKELVVLLEKKISENPESIKIYTEVKNA